MTSILVPAAFCWTAKPLGLTSVSREAKEGLKSIIFPRFR